MGCLFWVLFSWLFDIVAMIFTALIRLTWDEISWSAYKRRMHKRRTEREN
ncbi:MAG: hypothetical protein Q7N50_09185 [Armatimonadota bacterium]|nr:hypothetical protein [Armatimonadota bacterium]